MRQAMKPSYNLVMDVIVARRSGFCFGVRRATDIALKLKAEGKRVFTLGPIIHNEKVVSELEKVGVKSVSFPEEVPEGGVLLVRTHGVPKGVLERARRLKIRVEDTTCPFVLRSHEIVEKALKDGYTPVIFGDPEHPEVKAIRSYSPKIRVMKNWSEKISGSKLVVLSQTTQSLDNFMKAVKNIIKENFEVKIFNTVCKVMLSAQREALNLANKVDVMLIVGGRSSSNTDKLWKACLKVNPRSYKIEDASEIDPAWLNRARTVGVAGGMSTADWIIDDVKKALKEVGKC